MQWSRNRRRRRRKRNAQTVRRQRETSMQIERRAVGFLELNACGMASGAGSGLGLCLLWEDASKHAHVESLRPYQADQGMFRNQYIDTRTQMLGQQFQQFPYIGAVLPHKIPNGDYFDPRMQNRGQLQQQFFEPVQTQQQPSYEQSYQAMQMEKLARQQELLLGQGHGLGMQQLARPQMGALQVDNFSMGMRNTPIQTPPVYGTANEMDNRNMFGSGKPLESFPGSQSDSEALDNLHDLFGGVEKLFADDPVQESKSAIPGLGSLGASLINGCEAELFGDGGAPFFGRSVQYPFRQAPVNNGNAGNLQLEQSNFSQNLVQTPPSHMQQQQLPQTASAGNYANDGQFQQQAQGSVQQSLTRMDHQVNERWQTGNTDTLHSNLQSAHQANQMSRGTLQLFKDMDDNDNNAQTAYQNSQGPSFDQTAKGQVNPFREGKVDTHDAFRPVGTSFSLAVQDGNHRPESSQVRFPQNSVEGGLWPKDPHVASSKYQATSVGEVVNNQTSRLQPDRLLLDSGKPHHNEEVQKLLSFGNSNSNTANAVQHVGGMIGQPNEDPRTHNHQSDPSFRSRAYFEVLEQQKQQHQGIQEAQRTTYANGASGFSHLQAGSNYTADSAGDGKAIDVQAGQSSGTLPWNVSTSRQATPDAMLRGNSIEPSVPFKSPAPKPVFGTSSISLNDKASPSEAVPTKRRDDLYVDNNAAPTTSVTPLMDRGPFFSDKTDHKQSKNAFQIAAEKPESDASEQRASSIWPSLGQNPSMQFPSGMISTFQDMSRRHFLQKSEPRASMVTDIRHSGASRPESASIFSGSQMKEKDDMMLAKVFESSAPANAVKASVSAVMSSPPPSQPPVPTPTFQQERVQLLQQRNDLQRISRDFSGQPSVYGHTQHRPAESDSINDIVQLQQQARVGPAISQVPVPGIAGPSVQLSKPEQQSKTVSSDTKAAGVDQALPDGGKASTSDDRTGSRLSDGSKDDVRPTSSDNSSLGKSLPEKPSSQPSGTNIVQNQQGSQILGTALSQPNLAAMAHAKLVANQGSQLLQVPKEMQPVDLQRLQGLQGIAQVSLHQQRVQAALQAYAMTKGGYTPSLADQTAGTSALPAGRVEPAPAQGAVGQTMKQQLILNSTFANSVLPKKRKIEAPPLVPWRMAISQLTGALPTIRPAELQWAVDTNRLPEKEIDEDYYSQDESLQFVGRARQRLKLTTQLMQQSIPPIPAALMQSNTPEDRECAMYVLARLSLGEACRITANEDGPQAKTNTLSATSELIIEGFKDRVKYLERALQRLESLPLTLEFVKNMQYLDKVCVTNRLMKCHQELFPVNFTSQRRIQPVQRAYPQPYVTVAPMPNTLPEEFQLISL